MSAIFETTDAPFHHLNEKAYGKFIATITPEHIHHTVFQDHPLFPVTLNILARKNCHHVLLVSEFSSTLKKVYAEAFYLYLAKHQTSHNSTLLFLDIEKLLLNKKNKTDLGQTFEHINKQLVDTHRGQFLIVIPDTRLLTKKMLDEDFIQPLIQLLEHRQCRLLVFANSKQTLKHLQHYFSNVQLNQPEYVDIIRTLKHVVADLIKYHQVEIPDGLLSQAYALVKRYQNNTNLLENTLLLLDSAAARVKETQANTVLNATMLLNVLSQWTHIPTTHLQWDHFDLPAFTQGMQECLFGQEAGIAMIGQEIKQAQTKLRFKQGPLFHFLLAGPAHTGKRTAAFALSHVLFSQINVLYFVASNVTTTDFLELKLQRASDHQTLSLREVICQTSYAIIMFEAIEQSCPLVLNGLQEIISTGVIYDKNEKMFDFQQTIILTTTQLGSQHLGELAKLFATPILPCSVDLMQLIMNEQKTENTPIAQYYSPQELVNEILPEISAQLPQAFFETTCVVPFIPLTKTAIEKILQLALKRLTVELSEKYQVEFAYAPEVIRYLTHQVNNETNSPAINIEQAIEQVYYCVEQSFMHRLRHHTGLQQLFLQLNETGHLLSCNWLSSPAVRQHTP